LESVFVFLANLSANYVLRVSFQLSTGIVKEYFQGIFIANGVVFQAVLVANSVKMFS